MSSMGLDHIASINLYKRVVTGGYELLRVIDGTKAKEVEEYVKSLKRSISTMEFIICIVISLSTGLISGYLLSFI
ncbi:hypothetical protein C5S53_02820 [Methanophagales archaeon]|nr:hypothetical protein C5S53_02820 [Methanophagales archaeon]